MAIILFIGYLGLILWNLFCKKKQNRVQIPWLLAIGILVQLGWEAGLLLGGIRSAGFESFDAKMNTLIVNSLLETNLGMPYVYAIFIAVTAKYTETLRKRPNPVSFCERIEELNAEKVRVDKDKMNLT